VTARAGRRRIRARWIALSAVLLLILLSVRLLDRPAAIFYYRVLDERTLALGVVSGPGTWTRLTRLEEGPETVRLEVSSLTAPLPGYGDDAIEVTIRLHDPIGARALIDAGSGREVPRTHCLPPAYLAPGCT
jgi:hypothetical protein